MNKYEIANLSFCYVDAILEDRPRDHLVATGRGQTAKIPEVRPVYRNERLQGERIGGCFGVLKFKIKYIWTQNIVINWRVIVIHFHRHRQHRHCRRNVSHIWVAVEK